MIRAMYTSATGMAAQQLEQDVVANNLANVNTVGFKKSRADFMDLMYQITSKSGSQTTQGTQLPVGIEVGMGVKPMSTQKIFTQGDYQQTGNKFDFAIENEGFFQFDNNGTTVYSRAGSLKVNSSGVLVNSEGLQLVPSITIPTGTVSFTVDSGGTWSALDQSGVALATGRLQLATFINPAGLSSIGRNLYVKTESSGEPTVGNPGENGIGTISQNFLEMSNVNVVDEMVRMIVGQRAYEINSKSIQTADSMLSIINNLKR
ncbi:MAG: flagellar basal-body rod protein FlgG [Smithellaceae bacterium]